MFLVDVKSVKYVLYVKSVHYSPFGKVYVQYVKSVFTLSRKKHTYSSKL